VNPDVAVESDRLSIRSHHAALEDCKMIELFFKLYNAMEG
jgi:hypothetical protein